MKTLSLGLLVFIFLGCSPKLQEPEPAKEIIIKEPSIIEKTVYVEMPKEACPQPEPCKPCAKIKPCKPITLYKEYKKVVLGELEEVYFPVHDILLNARIDTGAQTSSVGAENIVPFERDGKQWVRFEILDANNNAIKIKRPIVKTIKVKRHGEKAQERYVVHMRVNIASLSNYIEVSLSDRRQYKFPVLIGRNYLQGNVLVDVSQQYTRKPNKDNE